MNTLSMIDYYENVMLQPCVLDTGRKCVTYTTGYFSLT